MVTINSSHVSRSAGIKWDIKYEELDAFDSIRTLPVGAAGAFCFFEDKLVLVYAQKRNSWELPGGGLEEGETFETGIIREIKEEANMKVLALFPLGYDTYTNADTNKIMYVLRYAAKVEPYGPFVSDPAGGEITEIKLINPEDYKMYFDWGERSDAMLKKAQLLLNSLK